MAGHLKRMKKKSFLKNFPNFPVMIMTGTNDFRAYTPYKDGSTDLSAHENFCKDINKYNGYSKSLCRFEPLKDVFHEILKESDEYRDPAIETIDQYFQSL